MPWRLALVGLLLLLAAPAAAARADRVLWRAGHETGDLSQWAADGCGGEFDSGGGRVDVAAAAAHRGRYGAELRLPDAAAGEQGARLFRWCEPQQHRALYYSAWYRLPRQYAVDGWWGLMQWKSEGSFNWKFAVMVGNRPDGRMFLFLGRGEDSGGGAWTQHAKNVPVDRWFHVEAYYEKAADNGGRVTVWQDGERILDVGGVQTANSDDLGWAVINYGEGIAQGEVVVDADDAAISTGWLGP